MPPLTIPQVPALRLGGAPQPTLQTAAFHPAASAGHARRIVKLRAGDGRTDTESNVVEGYDVDKPDIWESDLVGNVFKVGKRG